MHLADLGARVIKVEGPGGDYARDLLPGLFAVANRNKQGLSLDLKAAGALNIVDRLVRSSDVVVEGFRPGVAERLGIGYARLSDINPRIVYASISGFGSKGSEAARPGHDINYLAASGVLSIPGQYGAPSARGGLPIADLSAAMYASLAIVASLFETRRSGRGRNLEVAMLPSLMSWAQVRAADYLAADQDEWLHLSPLNDVFETRDGKLISLALVEPKFLAAFCSLAGCKDLTTSQDYLDFTKRRDPSAGKRLREAVQNVVAQRALDEWVELFDSEPIPFAPVFDVAEAYANPQLTANGFAASTDPRHPEPVPGIFPFPVSGIAASAMSPAPHRGEHSEQILREMGLPAEEIKKSIEQGAILNQ
jgi:crotonobetainyl-CoA:carnitine CoA-transferase CaiB-like acyl-CoA transferase